MEFQSDRPIWLQVMTDLQKQIVTEKRPPGSKMPGGRDLALEYGINPNTAARVYQELERRGLCETRRGLGTFVTEDRSRIASLKQEMARAAIQSFLDAMRELGIPEQEAVTMIERKD